MAQSSFANIKDLKYRITLAQTTFADGSNQVTFNGFRSTIDITMAGGFSFGSSVIKVWGLDQSVMNAVSTLTLYPFSSNEKNLIEVWAVDGEEETLVFTSNIVNAWGDYTNMPDVYLYMETNTCYNLQVRPQDPMSLNGTVGVKTVLSSLASKMDLILETTSTVDNMFIDCPYLVGSYIEQLKQLISATGLRYELVNGILSVHSGDEQRSGGSVYSTVISYNTGLVGYPTFNNNGVTFRCLFNPAIRAGDYITVESDIERANGTFAVNALNMHLSSNMPNGPWFMEVICTNVQLVPQ